MPAARAGFLIGIFGQIAIACAPALNRLKRFLVTTDNSDMDAIDSQIGLLASALNAAELRHRVIAHNVANVNTPGFKQLQVAFEEELAQALVQGGRPAAMQVRPAILEAPGAAARGDGNTVDIDAELARLGKNNVLYRAFAQLLAARMATMRSAVTGR
jgi:flagellar basal-body rod protein FlgB